MDLAAECRAEVILLMAIDISDLIDRTGPVTWLFCGDSITQGAKHTRGWRDYTQLFRERIGEMARNEDIVINTAVGGWSTQALEPRLDERILRYKPDAVFLMFGTNDAATGLSGIEAFETRYEEILKRIRGSGIGLVIVQTTVPMMTVDPHDTINIAEWPDEKTREGKLKGLVERRTSLEPYVSCTRRVAEKTGIQLIDHCAVWARVGAARGQLMDGGFHPNEYGHRLIAHTVFRECGIFDAESWTCRMAVPI